jgi:REP element-mobilizing transposase RayT
VAHRARPEHKRRHPVHVTLRVRSRLPSMREQVLFFEIRRCISLASRADYRVLHFSVQSDHVHPQDPTHFCSFSGVVMI